MNFTNTIVDTVASFTSGSNNSESTGNNWKIPTHVKTAKDVKLKLREMSAARAASGSTSKKKPRVKVIKTSCVVEEAVTLKATRGGEVTDKAIIFLNNASADKLREEKIKLSATSSKLR